MEALQGARVKHSENRMHPEVLLPLPSPWEDSSAHVPRVLRAQWMPKLWQGIKGTPCPTLTQPLGPPAWTHRLSSSASPSQR